MSVWQTPQPATRTCAWPSAREGSSNDSIVSVLGAVRTSPRASTRTVPQWPYRISFERPFKFRATCDDPCQECRPTDAADRNAAGFPANRAGPESMRRGARHSHDPFGRDFRRYEADAWDSYTGNMTLDIPGQRHDDDEVHV